MQEFSLNADQQPVGRLASKVASLLIGKNSPAFSPNKAVEVKVIVKNITQAKYSGRKLDQKTYYSHSGYLGNLRSATLRQVWQKDAKKVFKQIVSGMLPKNKLRAVRIKNLIVE